MPPPASRSDFLSLIERSRLATKEQVQEIVDEFEKNDEILDAPKQLAELLIKKKVITSFQAQQLLAGRHKGFFIGKYKILRVIGAGGMGKVYLAEHMIMRRQVAMKVLPKRKSTDSSALGRFLREARAVAALNHPNIVQAYDIDNIGDLHYMVMEYVEGMSLQDYVKKIDKVAWPLAADFICQSAAGLQHAHENNLVHRDIKPGNLLLDRTGTVKLLDLGLAVFFSEEEKARDHLTKDHDENVLGTADYLAPEQALDSHSVDIRADIYSLGCTFYYLLTGETPFPEGTIAQKLLKHQNAKPPPIEKRVPDISKEVVIILDKMMAKQPQDRYPSPGELAGALLPYAQGTEQPFDDEGAPLSESELSAEISQMRLAALARISSPAAEGGAGSPAKSEPSSWPSQPTTPSPSGYGRSPFLREEHVVKFDTPEDEEGYDLLAPAEPTSAGSPDSSADSSSDNLLDEKTETSWSDSGVLSSEIAKSMPSSDSPSSDSSLSLTPEPGNPEGGSSVFEATETRKTDSSTNTRTSGSSTVLKRRKAKPNKMPLYIGGGVSLLVVVIMIALFSGKGDVEEEGQNKPDVQEKVEDPKPPDEEYHEPIVLEVSRDRKQEAKYRGLVPALEEAKAGDEVHLLFDFDTPWIIDPLKFGLNSDFPARTGILSGNSTKNVSVLQPVKQQKAHRVFALISFSGMINEPIDYILRNLEIDGGGQTLPVLRINRANLKLENVVIRNFAGPAILITLNEYQLDRKKDIVVSLKNVRIEGGDVALQIEGSIGMVTIENCVFSGQKIGIRLLKGAQRGTVLLTNTTLEDVPSRLDRDDGGKIDIKMDGRTFK